MLIAKEVGMDSLDVRKLHDKIRDLQVERRSILSSENETKLKKIERSIYEASLEIQNYNSRNHFRNRELSEYIVLSAGLADLNDDFELGYDHLEDAVAAIHDVGERGTFEEKNTRIYVYRMLYEYNLWIDRENPQVVNTGLGHSKRINQEDDSVVKENFTGPF